MLALALVTVSTLHPRIYVRNDNATVGKGITVSQLRARAKDPAFARWRMAGSLGGSAGAMERAARYLETGDPDQLEWVRAFLAIHTDTRNDVGGFLAGAEMATAYDWAWAGLSGKDRKVALDNIVITTDTSARFLRRGGPDINHNYTYMSLTSVAVAGLVLKGEPEPYNSKGIEYLELARRFIEPPGMVLDTWKAREGAWSEGSHYTFHETLRNLVLMMQAYRTATATDYFAGRDFPAKAGRFLMASTRPDFTFERVGDTNFNRVQLNLTVPVTIEMLASGVDDPAEAARLRSFDDAVIKTYGDQAVHPLYGWGMRMFWEPGAPRIPSYSTLPLAMRMGAGTYEHIALRSVWGPDGTLVTILAGDQFTDHQHFDKGQFLIYHHGGLAVDSGAYDGMYRSGTHSNEYAPRTLAHNCLLIFDPDQATPKGYTNDGGQVVLRNKQHHPDWPTYLEHRDREGLNTADVLAYDIDAANGYDYVRADLTKAYGEKVKHYERQFVYLPGPDFLVVYDRAVAAKPEFQKRWLLHFQDQPDIAGDVTTVHRPEGGTLVIRTVLPAKHTITAVGGPGKEFLNPFNGVNYPPGNPRTASAPRESGAWRIEVAPAAPSAEDIFLHAFEMSGAVETRAVAGVPGVQFLSGRENQLVAFPESLPAKYELMTATRAQHILAGLPPSIDVVVEANGKRSSHKVNGQGVLCFRDKVKGSRRITVRRP